jgi:O-antigen/teichoic acid export membrane protein
MGMAEENTADIIQRAVRASKWGVLMIILPKIITPLITVALAHFLTPQDYGIVAIAALIVGLATIFQGMAIGQTLIQAQVRIEATANSCFWISASLGLLVSILIFFSAPILSAVFHDPRVTDVLRVQCWMIFFNSLVSVHEALLKRRFQFKTVFFVSIGPALIPLFVAFPMAVYGFGYWALVISSLLGAVIRCFILWITVPWRPRFDLEWTVTVYVLKFGGLVAVDGFCGWILNYGDNAVLGHFLGIKDLGLYVFAFSIIILVGAVLSSPVSSVSYSMLCRVQEDNEGLIAVYKKSIELIAVIIFPAFLGLSMVSMLLVQSVLGSKWDGLAPVLSILCIHPGLSFILSLNSEVYKAKGRPDITAKFQIISVLYLIPVYLFSVQFGLIGFCFGRFSMILTWIPHIIVISNVLNIKPLFIWKCIRFPLIASLFMCVIILPINWLTLPDVNTLVILRIRLVLSIVVAVATYIGIYYIFNRKFLTSGYRLIMRSILP